MKKRTNRLVRALNVVTTQQTSQNFKEWIARKAYSNQLRIDCLPIEQIALNFKSRDEIIPVLAGLQHLYSQIDVRDHVTQLIAADINEKTRDDIGREGLSYWQILVLGVVRLGCNLDYDKLQDLCENHRSLRGILGVGDWDQTSFGWRRIRDTLCRLKPKTLEKINQQIVLSWFSVNWNFGFSCRDKKQLNLTNQDSLTYSGFSLSGQTRK